MLVGKDITKELEIIKKYIEAVKYGSITIVIQDGKVIQIEKVEKTRLK
ncbi:MAG: DUF2292 domain-containing protein [Lachnospiraceae bacterium]|nr:DUF2292 domain-containing protein [Lachnospiraceae bacterium]